MEIRGNVFISSCICLSAVLLVCTVIKPIIIPSHTVYIQRLNSINKPLLDVSTVLSPNPAKFDQVPMNKVKWNKIWFSEVEISYKFFFFFKNLPAAHWLHLPDDVKFQIDDALSQFEAGDFQVHLIISYLIISHYICFTISYHIILYLIIPYHILNWCRKNHPSIVFWHCCHSIFVIRNTVTTFMTCPVSSTYLVLAFSIRCSLTFKLWPKSYLIISCQTCHIFSYLMIPYMTYHVSFTLIARASSIRFPYFVFLLSLLNNRMSNVTQPNLVFIHLLPSILVVIYSIELT